MARIPTDELERLKREVPIAALVEASGVRLERHGQDLRALCPFHDDSKPSLRVRLDTGGFRCMVCGAHGGDVLAFHMQRHGLSFKQAAQQLGAWRLHHG